VHVRVHAYKHDCTSAIQPAASSRKILSNVCPQRRIFPSTIAARRLSMDFHDRGIFLSFFFPRATIRSCCICPVWREEEANVSGVESRSLVCTSLPGISLFLLFLFFFFFFFFFFLFSFARSKYICFTASSSNLVSAKPPATCAFQKHEKPGEGTPGVSSKRSEAPDVMSSGRAWKMLGNVFVSPSGVVEDFTESPGRRGTRDESGSERGGRASGLAKGDVQRGKSGAGAEMRSIPHERRRRRWRRGGRREGEPRRFSPSRRESRNFHSRALLSLTDRKIISTCLPGILVNVLLVH